MRFTANGPSIPDALLQARDEGRVVFFCGAGVSRAKARLHDFFGLAESVIRELGVPSGSDACKVLEKARELGKELNVTGLISADRVFSLLERDFDSTDIQSMVAKCLAPSKGVDRSAHETLLRLARSPDGKTRIVTTNFDRLFESIERVIPTFQPPRLPDLSRHEDIDGIVYLHGRANNEYSGAEGDGFVLSSSDFGHAYLSEGWATEFFREVIRRYVVVFVGYSADDPPVHYLLEGIRRNTKSQNHIYAFQADESVELIARWRHKGVESIAYSPTDGHRSLWDTLQYWATRADDPAAWRHSILTHSKVGPQDLQPFERGQVAHIVSNVEGARSFADAAPPAEWLCVFDPACRYRRPEKLSWMDSESPTDNPFVLYGLDSDIAPQRGDDDSPYVRQTIPSDAWDAFAFNNIDLQDFSTENFASVRGKCASIMPRLPNRLVFLGIWLANVADQQSALWWAARQQSLHPDFRKRIEWKLFRSQENADVLLVDAWRYILDAWESPEKDDQRDWYRLKSEIDRQGWSSARVRRFVDLSTPYFKVGPGLLSRPVPPTLNEECRISDLVRIRVECPVIPHDAVIADEWLTQIVRGLRQNLEIASRLCAEVEDSSDRILCPIERDDSPDVSSFQRNRELSGYVITFTKLFERLVVLDLSSAKTELSAWRSDDNFIFARLRFWASGKSEVATPHQFAQVIHGLTDEAFWDSYHQRDLLLVLSARWRELSIQDRKQIEARLLQGPARWRGEDDTSFRKYRAWDVLTRLQWMKTHGCEFTFDIDNEMVTWQREVPDWKPEHADLAAESREIRGGFITIDTDCGLLIQEPISSILARARELSGRSEISRLRERDPFAGLCAVRPKRAYLALAHAAKGGEYPVEEWKAFLDSPAREKDKSKFAVTISARLCHLPKEVLSELLYSATWWLRKVSKAMSTDYPDCFDETVEWLIAIVQSSQASANSTVHGSSQRRDWVTEAINSPVGHLVQAIVEDTRIKSDSPTSVAPSLKKLGQLLELTGDPRRHVITLVSRDLQWFYHVCSNWTESHILSILDGSDEDDKESFWGGFLWHPEVASSALFLHLKEGILNKVMQSYGSRDESLPSLAYLTLSGWIKPQKEDGDRCISNDEFREALLHGGDEFRSQILWQFERVLDDDEATKRQEWLAMVSEFFQHVWPRQKSVKTSEMTVKLCELLLSRLDTFDAILDVVAPQMTSIQDGTGMHLRFRAEVEEIARTRPERFLRLLYQVLPENAGSWPYGIGDAIEWIVEADEGLINDTRLIQLRRRWKSR